MILTEAEGQFALESKSTVVIFATWFDSASDRH